MKRGTDLPTRHRIALGVGAVLAAVLCVQCVRTYLYTDAVLVPQQARREAERQSMSVMNAARSGGISDAHLLSPLLDHAIGSASDQVLWMVVRDSDHNVVAQAGMSPVPVPATKTAANTPDPHQEQLINSPSGKALVVTLPFRTPRTARPAEPGVRLTGRRDGPYTIEIAMSLRAVRGTFNGLRANLAVGLLASIALMLAVGIVALAMRKYFRGRYLESEMELAKRVQRDLQPQPCSTTATLTYAASSIAADQVGGDFFDVFEAGPGKTAIVLGDVSGKGVSAALLVGLIQGAIRSSDSSEHEVACERINRMLCERSATARFATLFWGVFDSESGTLRYVNAGHAAPMLVRNGQKVIERLEEGGPVLGLLPMSRYSAGTVRIGASDILTLYSDGITEAANQQEEEFGENRIAEIIAEAAEPVAEDLCGRVMSEVSRFAGDGPLSDDRTLLVVQFHGSVITMPRRSLELAEARAVA